MSVDSGRQASCGPVSRRPKATPAAAAKMKEPPATPTTAAHAKRRKLQLLANNSYLVVAAAAAANSGELDTTKPARKRQHFSEQTTATTTKTQATETTAIEPKDIVVSACKRTHCADQDTLTSRLISASTRPALEPETVTLVASESETETTTAPATTLNNKLDLHLGCNSKPPVVARLSGAPLRAGPRLLAKCYLHRGLSLKFLSVSKGAGLAAGHKRRLVAGLRPVLKQKLKTTTTSTTTTTTTNTNTAPTISMTVRPRRKPRQRRARAREQVKEEEEEEDAEDQDECKPSAEPELGDCEALQRTGRRRRRRGSYEQAANTSKTPTSRQWGAPPRLAGSQSQRRAKAQAGATKYSAPPPIAPVVVSRSGEQFASNCQPTSGGSGRESVNSWQRSRAPPAWRRLTSTARGQPLYPLLLVFILMQACDSQFIGTNNNNNNNNNNGADLELGAGQPLVGANEVAFVDLRVKENSIQHHTILYEQIDRVNPLNPTGPSMVLRRGELFNIIIHLRHTYNKQTDKIRLEFSFGQRPQVGKGTLIYLPITKDRDTFGRDPSKWDARVVRVDGNQLSVQINLPANIAVGVWRFRVSTKLAGSRTIRTYTCKESLYMIFNAWSKDDAVYLSREDARQEYVLNDVGKIYIGSHAKPRGRKWIYGQFQESVLPAVMFMLDKTRLDIVGRSSVVKVARAVSAMVNSHDDNGLLVGNWSGNYGDGLAPWQWTGSATILEKYLQSGGEPVKFGQCWVFAGVTTTALRTLGIPARTVSNFVSAHDTDDSLTVDKFFSEKGDPISDVNSDSIWNFHVWSDAWMARNDLPPGYGGWQAVDATPQETSMGMYQMGPASLEAIKKGEVGFAYDAAFVFAEVNADIVHWQQDDKSELQWKKIKTLKFHIGRKIFTKMIGQLDDYTANGVADAEDIISQYKNKEGTEDERMSVLNAARCGGLGFLFEQPAPGKEDVEFELFDIDKVQLGEPFLITVRIANKSPMRRTISLALSASSVYYTGILAQKVKRDRQNIVLNGLQEQQVRIRVNPDDYMERLVDYSMMKVYAIATVKETQQTWSKEDDFMIDKALLASSSRR